MNLKNGLFAGVIAILAVVAVIGWTHERTAQALNAPVTYTQPADYSVSPEYAQEQPEPYVNVIHRPVLIQQEPPPAPVYSPEPLVSGGAERHYYSEGGHYSEDRPAHHRSTKKSVAIVAGSAGVGAAVGALAGGGKGAGIGALAGGAGGFIYDRLTHNH
jgi:hypothetical protein